MQRQQTSPADAGHQEDTMKVALAHETEVQDGTLTEIDFFGRPAVLLRDEGRIAAYLNVCAHLGGPLQLDGSSLQCEWHGACFDARSGKTVRGPARPDARLIRLPVKVEDGRVFYVYGEEA
jgi:nitrite reductase/ring-hydroxylating ferredoxin subunit